MHRFSVWAPTAERVDLVRFESAPDDTDSTVTDPSRADQPPAETGRSQMVPGDGGWWRLEVADSDHGSDYAYSLDGGPALPDPRSAWQPHGVHGPSRVFDPTRYRWRDDGWAGVDVRGRVLYELHVGTFTQAGTLDAAVQRLDHLRELGVDIVQLMPLAAFPGLWGWGYDGVHPFAVHDPYGGPAALQRFVDAAHRRGLGVCLDVVYNHLGPSGNYLLQYGPYFSEKHHTPWGLGVNLDSADNGPVRRYLIDNALRWFRDFHIDALRLDAVHALADDSERHFLAELSDETAALAAELDRPLGLIAESDLNDPVMVTPTGDGGLGMTAQWADDVHHALRTVLTGETQGYYCDFGSLQVLAKTLTEVFRHDGGFSTFRGENWGKPVDRRAIDGHRFVAYTTTHDQTGNRATGDRLSEVLSPERLAIASAVILTAPFTPMIFMGEEYGARTPWQYFTDHAEPDLADAIRQGRRAEFAGHGWSATDIPDPQSHATRDRSVLDWDEPNAAAGARMLAWHRALIALRRRDTSVRDGNLAATSVDYDSEQGWFVIRRGRYRVAVNLADHAQIIPLDRAPQFIELSFSGGSLRDRGVRLPADGVAVVAIDAYPTVADAVTGYLTQTVDELRTAVDADDVHDMRVSCRRIRSILRAHAKAFRPDDRQRSIEIADHAREIARALSGDRDHEVAGEVIDDWASADEWAEEQRLAVHQALYPTQPAGVRHPKPAVPVEMTMLSSADARVAAGELASTVTAFLATVRWRGRASVPARGGLGAYRIRAAQRVIDRAEAAIHTHPADDPEELWHLVRKAAKRLRYTAEAGALVDDHGAQQIAKSAKQVQTVIGDLQDARLVRDRLAEATGEAVGTATQRAETTIVQKGIQIDPSLRELADTMPGLRRSTDQPPDDPGGPPEDGGTGE